ncbi:MAG: TadG family pilus assembly protein [Pirellula sp.]
MSLFSSLDHRKRRGASMLFFAILLPVLIAMLAFAVEIGRMYLVRSQLQTAVDAGALAASLRLRDNRTDVPAAIAAAQQFVQLNRVGAYTTVPADAITIQPGRWDATGRVFEPGANPPDAIQVSGTLDKEPFFFGRALGVSKFSVPRSAIAISGGNPMDIMMTLDLTGSMNGEGRIQALQNAAPIFVNVLETVGDNDRVGVMGYGAMKSKYNPAALGHHGLSYTSTPSSLYPSNDDWCGVLEAELTFDFDYLRQNVLNQSTLIANKYNGWTPIGAALRDSAHYLDANARPEIDKVIVLMSDGHANKPAGDASGYALAMASYATVLNIKIYTISLGSAADEDLMQQIADLAGGKHFVASGTSAGALTTSLTDAFKKIAGDIKQPQLVH